MRRSLRRYLRDAQHRQIRESDFQRKRRKTSDQDGRQDQPLKRHPDQVADRIRLGRGRSFGAAGYRYLPGSGQSRYRSVRRDLFFPGEGRHRDRRMALRDGGRIQPGGISGRRTEDLRSDPQCQQRTGP